MRIATWNVNSLKARLERVEEWLEYAQPDVLCLQETKMADKAFPAMAFSALGYESVHHGQGQWNGVAILSKVGIEDPQNGFGAGVVDPYAGDARMLAATCGGIRVVSVYVPNGREVPSEFYDRKLEWFARLAEWLDAHHTPQDSVVITGDFNVAPEDRDVWSIKAFAGSTHVTEPERDAVRATRGVGPRRRVPPGVRHRPPLQLLGLSPGRFPSGPGDADRPRARERARGRAGHLGDCRPKCPEGETTVGPCARGRGSHRLSETYSVPAHDRHPSS